MVRLLIKVTNGALEQPFTAPVTCEQHTHRPVRPPLCRVFVRCRFILGRMQLSFCICLHTCVHVSLVFVVCCCRLQVYVCCCMCMHTQTCPLHVSVSGFLECASLSHVENKTLHLPIRHMRLVLEQHGRGEGSVTGGPERMPKGASARVWCSPPAEGFVQGLRFCSRLTMVSQMRLSKACFL